MQKKTFQIHLKFCANYDYQVHAELDDEVQTGEKECKTKKTEIIPRMVKPPG